MKNPSPRCVVVSCEHASNRLPAAYGRLGLPPRVFRTHFAWDLGAAQVARCLARELGASLHLGRWSRLLIDLNRSAHNRSLIPERAFGLAVPGNRSLAPQERGRRLLRYYLPYRAAVLADVEASILRHGVCLHLSIHSFTPELHGRARNADVGLLYDPSRRAERRFVDLAAEPLSDAGLRVRLNYPYRGTSDCLNVFCRRAFAPTVYVGIEIELNQRLAVRGDGARSFSRAVSGAIAVAVDGWVRAG
jgi:predicted N-formylglutamate amidohydrolase